MNILVNEYVNSVILHVKGCINKCENWYYGAFLYTYDTFRAWYLSLC
jgi:hypothetical protein